MSEKDAVYSKINIVKNCLMAIEKAETQEKDTQFRQSLIELNLQRAVQASVDIANMVIAKEGLGLPNSYRQSFEILGRHQVISEPLLKTMVSMVGFRNIAVHDYQTIKPEIVAAIVSKHLVDFEAFYAVVYQRVQNWN
jgi:uncharacterized protein YutE (UPF0331/DUF86 family)